jgi:hypothetical protein
MEINMSRIKLLLIFAAGAVFATLVNSVVSAQFREVTTKQFMRADLGAWCPGKEVLISVQEDAPGTSGKHYHPAHSFTWMIEGTQTRTVAGKLPQVVRPGNVMHEEPLEIGETRNDAPAKVLIFRILEKGKPETTRVE